MVTAYYGKHELKGGYVQIKMADTFSSGLPREFSLDKTTSSYVILLFNLNASYWFRILFCFSHSLFSRNASMEFIAYYLLPTLTHIYMIYPVLLCTSPYYGNSTASSCSSLLGGLSIFNFSIDLRPRQCWFLPVILFC